MKILIRVALVILGGFLVLALIGYGVGRRWGRDLDHVHVSEGAFTFRAQRNEVGVWKVHVKDFASLSFAFGYLQGHDREFQTELLRRAGGGELSTIFGTEFLKRDRLLRFLTKASREEWNVLRSTADPLKDALGAFVAGRNYFGRTTAQGEPIEYRIFQLKRAEIREWTEVDVLAISRLQAWQFSSDYRQEVLRRNLRTELGPTLGYLMSPSEPVKSPALYEQSLAKAWVSPPADGSAYRRKFSAPVSILPQIRRANATMPPSAPGAPPPPAPPPGPKDAFRGTEVDPLDPSLAFGKIFSASNSWLLADPRVDRPLTLCNDTHLEFSYPSPLYPLEYVVETDAEEIRGTGYLLPGVPFLVLGRIERTRKSDRQTSSVALGITIAEFADLQDLVELRPATIQAGTTYPETFLARDPRTLAQTTQEFTETWTDYGPRVDEILFDQAPPTPLALDWVGFRNTRTPMHFFLKRNQFAAEGFREDLMTEWQYPSVNLSAIRREFGGPPQAAHWATGLIYEAASPAARAAQHEFSTEEAARARRLSFPWERPFIDAVYSAQEPLFVASANQRVYAGDLGLKLAYEWTNSARADRIVAKYDQSISTPEFSQTDYFAGDLQRFIKQIRREIPAGELCASPDDGTPCLPLLAALDKWDGIADKEGWETTFASLWRNTVRLWPGYRELLKDEKAKDATLLAWLRNNMADRSLAAVLGDAGVRAQWEKATNLSFKRNAIEAFEESLARLTADLGPDESFWKWGRVHAIEWQHPFARIPGALGPMLRDSTLGPPPAISGADDSPGAGVTAWNPRRPTDFGAVHGASLRFCAEFTPDGRIDMRWANVTGVSGNPFSKWAWKFSSESWFKGKLLPVSDQ